MLNIVLADLLDALTLLHYLCSTHCCGSELRIFFDDAWKDEKRSVAASNEFLFVCRYYHSDDCFWVSVRSLQQYRKLAIRAREQRQKPAVECVEINFTGPEGADAELKVSCYSLAHFSESGSGRNLSENERSTNLAFGAGK